MQLVVWASQPIRARVEALVGAKAQLIVASSYDELCTGLRKPNSIGVIDFTTSAAVLSQYDGAAEIIAFSDDTVQTAIHWLASGPAIAHVTSVTMLDDPYCAELFGNVIASLEAGHKPRLLDWLSDDAVGRRVRLTHAGRRGDRLDKLSAFFTANSLGSRTVEQLRDAAEELLTNAFYDAPVAAGVMKRPVSRTQDIELPDDCGCDLAYGVRGQLAIVRVRDPFGSLTRQRLIDVLVRCSRTDMGVEVDETMGGAGLGMWRIFSAATFVAVSVVNGRHTEILVGITKRAASRPRPFSFHLFFREATKRRFWTIFKDDESAQPGINHSVLLVEKTK